MLCVSMLEEVNSARGELKSERSCRQAGMERTLSAAALWLYECHDVTATNATTNASIRQRHFQVPGPLVFLIPRQARRILCTRSLAARFQDDEKTLFSRKNDLRTSTTAIANPTAWPVRICTTHAACEGVRAFWGLFWKET